MAILISTFFYVLTILNLYRKADIKFLLNCVCVLYYSLIFHSQAHFSTDEELHKLVELPVREIEDVHPVLKVLALMCDSQIADIQVHIHVH